MVNGIYKAHPIGDGKDAFRASLTMILKHTADMFVTILEAMSEKYGHDVNEMMEVVIDHPKYKEMQLHPVLYDMGYLSKVEPVAPAPAPPELVAPAPAPAPKRKFMIKPKATPVATSAVEPPVAPVAPKKFKIKKSLPTTEEPNIR